MNEPSAPQPSPRRSCSLPHCVIDQFFPGLVLDATTLLGREACAHHSPRTRPAAAGPHYQRFP